MKNEFERKKYSWFANRVKQFFGVLDEQGCRMGSWQLTKVEQLDSSHLSKELDAYWLEFEFTGQWSDGIYILQAQDGERVLIYAGRFTKQSMQITVN